MLPGVDRRGSRVACLVVEVLLFVLALAVLTSISLGQVARWDLLQQVAMADRFLAGGPLYPDIGEVPNSGVSVYLPGNAFVVVILSKLGVDDNLVELMHIIACAVIVLFLLLQFYIARKYVGYVGSLTDFLKIAITVAFIPCAYWLTYAAEFKPDTISYMFGFCGLLLFTEASNKRLVWLALVGGLVTSFGVIFKQQYIPFAAALVISCTLARPATWAWYAGSITVLSSTFLAITLDENAWYWTVTILSDDGLLSLPGLISTQLPAVHTLAMSILVLTLLGALRPFLLTAWHKAILLVREINIWFLPVLMGAGLAVGSALKDGGNAGNVQVALILLLPLWAFALISAIPRRAVTSLAWLAVVANLSEARTSLAAYQSSVAVREFVTALDLEENSDILIEANTYYAIRPIRDAHNIIDYWSLALKENSSTTPYAYAAHIVEEAHIDLAVLLSTSVTNEYFDGNDTFNKLYHSEKFVVYQRNGSGSS